MEDSGCSVCPGVTSEVGCSWDGNSSPRNFFKAGGALAWPQGPALHPRWVSPRLTQGAHRELPGLGQSLVDPEGLLSERSWRS